jgi:hypothetical protein
MNLTVRRTSHRYAQTFGSAYPEEVSIDKHSQCNFMTIQALVAFVQEKGGKALLTLSSFVHPHKGPEVTLEIIDTGATHWKIIDDALYRFAVQPVSVKTELQDFRQMLEEAIYDYQQKLQQTHCLAEVHQQERTYALLWQARRYLERLTGSCYTEQEQRDNFAKGDPLCQDTQPCSQ